MARVLRKWQFLLPMWIVIIQHTQEVKTEVRIPCGMVKDWFPSSVQPQSSKPPYVLDVIHPDGKPFYLDKMYRNESYYGPEQETYTSEIFAVFFLSPSFL